MGRLKKEQRQPKSGETPHRRLDPIGKGGTGPEGREESSHPSARTEGRALTHNLMEQVCTCPNLNQAYKRVEANKGAPGIDGMTVDELKGWLKTHGDEVKEALRNGTYQPSPVKGVSIPKPSGGERQLGIPTAVDRFVQQALLQVLSPLLDPHFSESSFGFRPGRSAHDALQQASGHVEEGYGIVVDLDIEKFFDRVNHDVLMNRLGRHVRDKRVLRLIGRFLRSGMMMNGVKVTREEGTPQGGPLSPLLANLLLDDLDKELEKRGHRFCRYADDCNIYVQSIRAGERVLASLERFLEKKLRLKVNRSKSAVDLVKNRAFLGYRLLQDGRLTVAPHSWKRCKDKIRRILRRNRPMRFEDRIQKLNQFITGWLGYFQLAHCKTHLTRLDEWIRRRLRCIRLKQCKRPFTIAKFLMAQGVRELHAWLLALSGKGWWRMTFSPQADHAMSIGWFQDQGLVSLAERYQALQLKRNRRGTE